jgi:hypothetical protein
MGSFNVQFEDAFRISRLGSINEIAMSSLLSHVKWGLNTKKLLQELNNIHGYVIFSKQERISD